MDVKSDHRHIGAGGSDEDDDGVRALAEKIRRELDRVGFNEAHLPELQPSLIPIADAWIVRWADLLRESPWSATALT